MITIKVTQEDIDNGIRRNCNRCPIARAARRVMKKKGVEAGPGFIGQAHKYSYLTPYKARAFMKDFDKGNKVIPITFTLTERIARIKNV